MTRHNGGGRLSVAIWEDLVNDFLEMACFLSDHERNLLLQKLGEEKIAATSIHVCPSFVVDQKIVIVSEEVNIEESWFYYPRDKRIERYPLKQNKKK